MIPLCTVAVAAASAGGRPPLRAIHSRWSRGVVALLTCVVVVGAASVGAALVTVAELHHVYFDRQNLPDVGPFTRFDFPTIGHIYDVNGEPLIELAREYRQITQYEDIPPIVRDAILATED